MATHHGNEGQVKVGANAVAEVTGWTISENYAPPEDTAMGDTWKTFLTGGPAEWDAEVSCHWDETDTNGQLALTIGSSVTLNLYPEGSTTGDKYYSGTAIVTAVSRQGTIGDVVGTTFQCKGSGALTFSTAA